MDTYTQSVSGAVVGPAKSPKRQLRTIAEKRQIVEETMVEGASVARIARAHGVNANQVFYWRMLYRKGRLGAATLLPVRVTSESLSLQAPSLQSVLALNPSLVLLAPFTSNCGMHRCESREAPIQRCCGCCWSVCSGDRTPHQHAYLDCCRRDRPATRLHGPERARANQAGAKSDVRSRVCVSRPSRRSD